MFQHVHHNNHIRGNILILQVPTGYFNGKEQRRAKVAIPMKSPDISSICSPSAISRGQADQRRRAGGLHVNWHPLAMTSTNQNEI